MYDNNFHNHDTVLIHSSQDGRINSLCKKLYNLDNNYNYNNYNNNNNNNNNNKDCGQD